MSGDDLGISGLIVGCTGVLLASMHGVRGVLDGSTLALLFLTAGLVGLLISVGADLRDMWHWYQQRDEA